MNFFHLKLLLIVGLLFIFVTASSADPAATELLSSGRMNDAVSILSSRADAESLNQLSRAYFAMERWDEAVRYGERAVSLDPNNATYHLWLGREYGRKAADANPLAAAGLARKAENEFERAVQLDPANVAATTQATTMTTASSPSRMRPRAYDIRTACARSSSRS